MKKPTTTSKKPASKAKAEQPAKAVVTKAKPKKPNKTAVTKSTPKKPKSETKSPKKAQAVAPKPVVATSEMTMPDRIGTTAGSIWHYLTENGATSVAKLFRELTEDEKIIQRSIGWLAKEGKITLNTTDRAETIALKD